MRAILTYHSIDDSGSVISLSRAAFARHVRWLASGAVEVVSLDALLKLPDDAEALAITFDDGFQNFEDEAAPLLLDHGLPVTVFVVTDRAGRNNAWNSSPQRGIPTLPLLGWPALARLAAAGVTLGSHSRTHCDLAQATRAVLMSEIQGSAERLRMETGIAPRHFAYPYGSNNRVVVEEVAVSFQLACTTDLRPLSDDDPMCLPRLDTFYLRDVGGLEAWGSTRFRSYLRLRAKLRGLRAAFAEAYR